MAQNSPPAHAHAPCFSAAAQRLPARPDRSCLSEYEPLETPLLKQARMPGLDVVDGLDMLIGQAALAFELFFKKPPPAGCDDELRERLLK